MTEPKSKPQPPDHAPAAASETKPAEEPPVEEKRGGFFARGKVIAPEKSKPTPSEKEITALKGKAELADKHWDRLLRLQADFDNFRKRIARENEEKSSVALQGLLKKLLPILDDFDRALPALKDDGAKLVFQKFRGALSELGVEEINAVGQPFDPHQHEAIAHLHSDTQPEGIVIEQTRKGYKLCDKLLRVASVVVSKGKAAPPPAPPQMQ